MDPAVVSSFLYVQNDKEDLVDMFGALKLDQASGLVLLPMSDNTDPSKLSGGSHWTLLVQFNGEQFWYLDSVINGQTLKAEPMMHMNIKDTAQKLKTLQGKKAFAG